MKFYETVRSDKSPESETVIRTGCTMVSPGCRVNIVVDDGKITQVRPNPEDEKNGLCIRPHSIPEWVYSKERLTSPLKRENGIWKQISWDEALSFIAEKLLDIKEKYGAKALVVHTGQALVRNVVRRSTKRFCHAYGTPNFTSSLLTFTTPTNPSPSTCFTDSNTGINFRNIHYFKKVTSNFFLLL